eukprot:TRINITY_DN24273_c0_g1_i3.p1 TRINITY_DN24273_c0_g1~~TRINITY_DN24273_c0_g1_i3.p1  ORF type:complete len:331 (+),score=52.26 TRINITY_DN24273_c0_g1_i3:88-1080(+)
MPAQASLALMEAARRVMWNITPLEFQVKATKLPLKKRLTSKMQWLHSMVVKLALVEKMVEQAAASGGFVGEAAVLPGEVRLWPNLPPGEKHGVFGSEIRSAAGDRSLVSEPTLMPYLVPGSKGPAIIVAPGGSYMFVSGSNEGSDVAEWLNSIGISAFVLKYRVPDRPWLNGAGAAALMDAQRAVSLVRSGALGDVDPGRVGIIGFSAGGNLTAQVCSADRAYTEVDSAEQCSCVPDAALLVYPGFFNFQQRAQEGGVGENHPPAFVASTIDDPIERVQNSVVYFRALRAVGAECELHVYRSGGHGFGIKSRQCPWTYPAENFLRRSFRL